MEVEVEEVAEVEEVVKVEEAVEVEEVAEEVVEVDNQQQLQRLPRTSLT